MLPANRAVGIAPQLHLVEFRRERIEEQQLADQRLADAERELQRLVGLQRADHAGQDAQHAPLRAGGGQLGRRRRWEEAAVAGAFVWLEDGHLPLEAVDRPVHDGDAVPDGGVVHEVTRREVVGGVDDHVPAVGEDALDVLRGQALLVGDDLNVGVERLDRALGGVDLGLAQALGRMNDLPLEVGLVDDVCIDDPEPSHARGSKVEGGRRAETARADEQDLGVEQLQLPLLADLGDEEVPAVARATRCVEAGVQLHREAVALPVGETARQRRDVLVAEVAERLRSEGGAVPGRAVDDDRAARVGSRALDAGLEVSPGHVHRTGDVALVPLVLLTHVNDECPAALDELARTSRVNLVDLGPDLLEKLSIARHRYRKYSFARLASVACEMSARAKVWIIVGLAALAAAGTAVGVTLATRSDVHRQSSKPPPFVPDPTARPEVAQQVREALQAWPAGTARRLRILAARYPRSALV